MSNVTTSETTLENIKYVISYVLTYYGMTIIVAGFIGNVFIAMIMYMDTSLRISTRIFTTTLSVIDEFILLVPGVRYWLMLKPDNPHDLRIYNEWICKGHVFVTYMALDCSLFTLTLLGVERLALVLFPTSLWLKTNLKIKSIVVVLILFVADLIKNIPLLFYSMIFHEEIAYCDWEPVFSKIFASIDTLVARSLPLVILIMTSGLLVVTLHKRRRHVGIQQGNLPDNSPNSDKMAMVATKMYLSVSIIHSLTSGPSIIYLCIWSFVPDLVHFPYTTIMYTCLLWLNISNAAWRFYIYCMFLSRFKKWILRFFTFQNPANMLMSFIPTRNE
jgi:hypothetical protein